MKRREFIATTTAGAVGFLWGWKSHASDGPAQKDLPNILFIMTDQQHAGMMSCTGNKWLKTPAMDQLAASGIRFERAYACNPVCVPNRFSLQTGLMPSAIGMGRNEDSKESTVTDAMVEQALGNLLCEAGYETVFGGKTHFPHRMHRLEDLGYRDLTRDSRQGLADACAAFIKEPHTKPFFLFASFINPHDICYGAINDYRRSIGEEPIGNLDSKTCEALFDEGRNTGDLRIFAEKNCPPLPDNHEVPEKEPECITENYTRARTFRAYVRENWSADQWRLHRWAYCRLTEMVDKKIGIVLDALDEAGLVDNTLIVFTSDHGDMDASHKMEHKSVLYEEAVRIPFIMSYKGKIPAGVVNDEHLISNGLDLMPTLCDYAKAKLPEGRKGRSLRPLAEGNTVGDWRDFVVSESQNGRMVQTDRFKYCVYDSGAHREQLTDLKNDPGEMKNLAELEEYKDVRNAHRRLLQQWIKDIGDKIAVTYTNFES